jgi:hypothetical protein
MSKPQPPSVSEIKPVKRPRIVKRIEVLHDGWPKYGLLRCDQIISPGGPLPLSKSQFWVLVKKYELIAVMLSPRVTAFWVHDLRRAFFGEASPLGPHLEAIAPGSPEARSPEALPQAPAPNQPPDGTSHHLSST